jgi:hypothetical protein
MKPLLIVGVLLVVLGGLALLTQGFTFTHREKVLDVGPIHATADKEESVPLPPVVGFSAIGLGLVFIVVGFRRPQ